jgi:hypothetical protein
MAETKALAVQARIFTFDRVIESWTAGFIDQQFDTITEFMRNDGRFYLGQIERETFTA